MGMHTPNKREEQSVLKYRWVSALAQTIGRKGRAERRAATLCIDTLQHTDHATARQTQHRALVYTYTQDSCGMNGHHPTQTLDPKTRLLLFWAIIAITLPAVSVWVTVSLFPWLIIKVFGHSFNQNRVEVEAP